MTAAKTTDDCNYLVHRDTFQAILVIEKSNHISLGVMLDNESYINIFVYNLCPYNCN